MEQRLQGPTQGSVLDADAAHKTLTEFLRHGEVQPQTLPALAAMNSLVNHDLQGVTDFNSIARARRPALRLNIYLVGTIEAANLLGLPVSTTHILSSGIAGTMVANGSGVRKDTVRNIILAWVLTLPVCVLLGAALFGAGLFFVLHVLGVH